VFTVLGLFQGQTLPDGVQAIPISRQFLLPSLALRSGDTCSVLLEAKKQEEIVLYAYENSQVLCFAQDSGLDWLAYGEAVQRLALGIYGSGSIEAFNGNAGGMEKLFSPAGLAGDGSQEIQATTVMETHFNGTIWGYDRQGNHVLLVNRGGLINEANRDAVEEAHQEQFGKLAGSVLFYAHLAHEMRHSQQIRAYPVGYVPTLEDYQQNEIEAYRVSIGIKEEAIKAFGCQSGLDPQGY